MQVGIIEIGTLCPVYFFYQVLNCTDINIQLPDKLILSTDILFSSECATLCNHGYKQK